MSYAHGRGWIPDSPDPRDLHFQNAVIWDPLSKLRPSDPDVGDASLEEFIECNSAPSRHSSAALACLTLIEYLHRRSIGHGLSASAEFLAHVTARLQSREVTGSGTIRNTFKAIRRFGTPPTNLWDLSELPVEQRLSDPSLFAYDDYQSLIYFRLDSEPSRTGILGNLKAFLAAGFPTVFGLSLPSSADEIGQLVFRPDLKPLSGHVLLAIGYDDELQSIRFVGGCDASWCKNGLLPYELLTNGACGDFWSCFQPELLTVDFRQPRLSVSAMTGVDNGDDGVTPR